MTTLRAAVPTAHASRYLQQLCKHWSHKFDVTFDPAHGTVNLNAALCRFDAEADRLLLTLEGPDDLTRLSGVVAEHLKRFAFKEDLSVEWADALAEPRGAINA